MRGQVPGVVAAASLLALAACSGEAPAPAPSPAASPDADDTGTAESPTPSDAPEPSPPENTEEPEATTSPESEGEPHPYPEDGTDLVFIGHPAIDGLPGPDDPPSEFYLIRSAPADDAEVLTELVALHGGRVAASGENLRDPEGQLWIGVDRSRFGAPGWIDSDSAAAVASSQDITATLDLTGTFEEWEDLAEAVISQHPLAAGDHEALLANRPTFDDVIAIEMDILIPPDGALRGERLSIHFDDHSAIVAETGWRATAVSSTRLCDPAAPPEECAED